MFLITPKPRGTVSEGCHGRPGYGHTGTTTTTGPTRVANACGRCRLRKTKCNGEEPCSRCVRADAVCTFPSPGEEGRGPTSAAYVSMLESQQRRLITAIHSMSDMLGTNQDHGAADPSHKKGSRTFNLLETLERYAPSSKNYIAHDEAEQLGDYTHQTDRKKRRRNSDTTSGDPNLVMQLPLSDTMDASYKGSTSDLGMIYPVSFESMQDSTLGSGYNNQSTAAEGSLSDLNVTSSYEKYSMMMRLMRQQGTMPGSPSFELQPTSFNTLPGSGFGADTNMSGYPPQPNVQSNGQNDDLFSLIDWDASWQTFVDNYGGSDVPALSSPDAYQNQPC